ncbi:unnamed protein product [Phyllotreta striolata]|uniref:Lipase domain-containing protein n=1 Tax=Phyllotreta striolata TaxID=444603 RepID=A0A9N9TMX1_PHYSR|nr:unnamed protein product [Phyllotreta striolata]
MILKQLFYILFTISSTSTRELKLKSYFFSTLNPSEGIQLDMSDPVQVAEVPFINDKETFIYVHGRNDDVLSIASSGQQLKYTLLLNHDINIFLVDWSNIANRFFYPSVINEVDDVGKALGDSVWSMVENNGLMLANVTMAGNAIGAHVVGVAGRELDGAVKQIIGLAPTEPGFFFESSPRISNTSAKFVEVIHTSGVLLAHAGPLGHADYFPNGGQLQPMCITKILGSCSEKMALTYYLESLLNGKYIALNCMNYDSFRNNVCEDKPASWMGGYGLDKDARGLYFLDTNNYPPYAKYRN